MEELQRIVDNMDPGAALSAIGSALKKVLVHFDDEARVSFVSSLLDEQGADKVVSMVNL